MSQTSRAQINQTKKVTPSSLLAHKASKASLPNSNSKRALSITAQNPDIMIGDTPSSIFMLTPMAQDQITQLEEQLKRELEKN